MYHQDTFNQNPLKNIPPAVETTFNFQRLKDGYFAFRSSWKTNEKRIAWGISQNELCEFTNVPELVVGTVSEKITMYTAPLGLVSSEDLSGNDWLYATDPMGFNVLKSQKALMWECNITPTSINPLFNPPTTC